MEEKKKKNAGAEQNILWASVLAILGGYFSAKKIEKKSPFTCSFTKIMGTRRMEVAPERIW